MATPKTIGWTITEWQQAYQNGAIQLDEISHLVGAFSENDSAWISIATPDLITVQINDLKKLTLSLDNPFKDFPLYGIPFAVKDNIDVKDFLTTAACPTIQYVATDDAFSITLLKKAGAIVVGKTNLDQFATGLVGTRSPYGVVPNTFNPDYVSGGSSSGSASVVARGLVPFTLGTDTAGSGRVPAGFNNIVGLKPTKGWFSNEGMIRACRSIDCISVFALTVEDADLVAQIMGQYDVDDAYARKNPLTTPSRFGSKPKFAVPNVLTFFGDQQSETAFEVALDQLRAIGVEIKAIDFSPFYELAKQLYQGSWVAERTVAIGALLEEEPDAIDPTVYDIVKQGKNFTATDAYEAEYLRADLARQIQLALEGFDALVVPTSPTIHTIAEMAEQPIAYNSQFGTYTNFTNLADLSALALPAGFRADGLPFGITLLAPAWHDAALAYFGKAWQQFSDHPLGALDKKLPQTAAKDSLNPNYVRLAVVGAHLSGMPLNFQLTTRNAVLVETTTTAPVYKLYALNGTVPLKPALERRLDSGSAIIVEVWEVPAARFGEIVAEVPTPLGIGNVELADGRWVKSFICEPYGLTDAKDISHFGGWRAFIQHLKAQ